MTSWINYPDVKKSYKSLGENRVQIKDVYLETLETRFTKIIDCEGGPITPDLASVPSSSLQKE